MLGKMLSTTRLPARSAGVTSLRSPLVRVNDGVGEPTVGRSPTVWTGLPPSAVCSHAAMSAHALDRAPSSPAAAEVAHVDEHHDGHRDA